MGNKKEILNYSWEDTGNLDIEVVGNLFATVRYKPSDKFVQETLAKLRKRTGSGSKEEEHTNSHTK